jgi:hypothetical protein
MATDRYTSEFILDQDDLYSLQDTFNSSWIEFEYQMTEAELGWLDFVRGKYSIADWIDENLDGDVLTFTDPHSMSEALDNDCHGWGKATCLDDATALQRLFFWLYEQPENRLQEDE